MNARELASSHVWHDLAHRHGCSGPAAEALLEDLVRAYADPHRHYHTLDHIASLLQLLEEHSHAVRDRNAVALSILFHDVVYDPARHDNEQMSAALAGERLAALGFPHELVAKVTRYIRATQHGQGAQATDDADLVLLLDLDLSILAATPAEYRAYAHAIRHEYALVPDELYRPGRRRILEGFLARERIYRTERLRALWDEPARANIAGEMAELA